MTASPLAPGANLSPEDLARLFGRMPLGAPQGFAPIAESEADVQRLEASTGMVPQRAGLAEPAPLPQSGAMTVPLPPTRPSDMSTAQADIPAAGAKPIMAPPQAGLASPVPGPAPSSPGTAPAAPASSEEPGFLDKVMGGIRSTDGLLTNIGIGLMSTPGWGQGVAVGLRGHQTAQKEREVTDLARAELDLKQRKLAQETGALSGNASFLKKVYPGLSDQEAVAMASNSSALTEALKISRDPNYGRENDPSVIRAKAQAQAEGAAAGGNDSVQIVTRPDGSVIAVNKSQLGDGAGVTTVAPSASKLAPDVEERKQIAVGLGYEPDSDQFKSYVATGKLPKEDQQSLTVTDKKAILEADEAVAGAKSTVGQLKNALELSKSAYSGPTASMRGYVTSLWGDKAGVATQQLDNQITAQALESLKSIFGAAPTEGERKILLEIQGSASQAPEVRESIYRRAIAAAERRQTFNEERANQLRGGTFYRTQPAADAVSEPRPSSGAPPASAPAATASDPLSGARAAISAGADRKAVIQRLINNGINPKGL